MIYGISGKDLLFCQLKLKNQKDFLKQNSYINSMGEVKSYLDLSMAANFSPNYYSEVANRVNTLSNLSSDERLTPVFITITLNGCFRKALCGDFSTFKAKDRKYLPFELKYKLEHNISFTIKDLCSYLNHCWNLFIMRFSAKFKKIQRSYIRCFEPHKKDGVPHIHALFYAPKETLKYAFEIYKDIFYAPQNLRKNQLSIDQIKNGEINGFQWTLTNPTGYVMKYITKTFINYNESESLDYLCAWYVKHKVRRFLSSRTPIPLWVYRKINFINNMKDFTNLCNIKLDENSFMEWDYDSDYIFFSIPETGEELVYEKGSLLYYKHGYLKAEYHKEKPIYKNIDTSINWDEIRKNHKNVKLDKLRALNQKRRNLELYYSGELNPKEMSITNMTDWTLVNYYLAYDHSDENVQRLAILENELHKRGFNNLTKNNELLNVNDIDELNNHFIDKEMKYLDF